MNALCRLLGIRIPVLQAPTGSIAGPALAAAVGRAGGLGALGLTWTAHSAVLQRVRQLVGTPGVQFQANFALAFEPRELDTALGVGVCIVTFSFGDCSPYVARVHAAGAIVGVQVGSVTEAARALNCGADFLICQGAEAGGHLQSEKYLSVLVPEVVALRRSVPVVAAGGITCGADVARVMQMGAQGAMLGTRYVATRESLAHPDYKKAILRAGADSTVRTECFSVGWPNAPHRVLRNRSTELWDAAGRPTTAGPHATDIVAVSRRGEPIYRYEDTAPRRGMTGAITEMALYAGEGAGRITDLPSAYDVTMRIWAEASVHFR